MLRNVAANCQVCAPTYLPTPEPHRHRSQSDFEEHCLSSHLCDQLLALDHLCDQAMQGAPTTELYAHSALCLAPT